MVAKTSADVRTGRVKLSDSRLRVDVDVFQNVVFVPLVAAVATVADAVVDAARGNHRSFFFTEKSKLGLSSGLQKDNGKMVLH